MFSKNKIDKSEIENLIKENMAIDRNTQVLLLQMAEKYQLEQRSLKTSINEVKDIKETLSDFEQYKEMRSEITYEANLAIGRTSWFVASQAFLFVSLSSAITVSGPQATIGDSLLFPLIPIIGIIISVVTLISVGAALARAWTISSNIKDDFKAFVDRYQIKESGITAFLGSLSTVSVPLIFAVVWIIVLVLYQS